MKRKIAVFGCGWSNEYIMVVSEVLVEFGKQNNADIFFFMNYYSTDEDERKINESNIFRLPDLTAFDGAVVLGSTLHVPEEYAIMKEAIEAAGIPAVCLGYQMDGLSCFECENYHGMYELVEHLVTEHEVRDVLFFSGPANNQESELRMKAMLDVLDKYGIPFSEEQVIPCDWSYHTAQFSLDAWLKQHDRKCPDAVICANDVMAMGCCAALEELRIPVPQDVIVTGFDDLVSGYVFSPSLTSVNPGWDDMTKAAMEHLWKCIDNGNEIIHHVSQSRMSVKRSCGCTSGNYEDKQRKYTFFVGYERMVSASYLGGHLCDMSKHFAEVTSEEEFAEVFEHLASMDYRFEGNEMYVCLPENFFESLEREERLQQVGYTCISEMIGGVKGTNAVPRKMFATKDLVPDRDETEPRHYLLIPLYSKLECYGYAVFVDHLRMLYDYTLFVWAYNMGQNLERVRQNIIMKNMHKQLQILSVTDPLTGVYNRMGCEQIAFPYIEKNYGEGKWSFMIFLDVNKMKVINDSYGHEQGDLALKLVAKCIQLSVPEEWIVARYGGDEFLVAGTTEDDGEVNRICKHITEMLIKVSVERNLPYQLSVGIGTVYIDPEEELDLHRSLRVADAKMYAMKKNRDKK